jgi:hypothetical protein
MFGVLPMIDIAVGDMIFFKTQSKVFPECCGVVISYNEKYAFIDFLQKIEIIHRSRILRVDPNPELHGEFVKEVQDGE